MNVPHVEFPGEEQSPTLPPDSLTCLMRWHEGRSFAETLVDRECSRSRFPRRTGIWCRPSSSAWPRNQTWLDHVIDSLRKGRLDLEMRLILQLGLCQLFLLGMADHAAVYETVNLAPARLRGLVNAILRNALRREKAILEEREKLPLPFLFHPGVAGATVDAEMEPQTVRALLHWNNTTPRLYVRANPLVPVNGMPASLAPLDRAPGWFSVDGALPLEEIKAGSLYVADPPPATPSTCWLLAGEEILDACAAPAANPPPSSPLPEARRLTATDLHEHRLPTLKENLDRQGSSSVRRRRRTGPSPALRNGNAVLTPCFWTCPCSNTGVIQRRVDVRWRLTPQEIRRLAALQRSILENASQAVKPGGRLVYSTCSIDAEEDGLVVRDFLQNHPEWTLKEEKLILPHEEKSDGAYAALLICA
ncbi:MAG: transcription antitermination factor NusB [Akkermansia sp.]